MKLVLKKEIKENGDIFYNVFSETESTSTYISGTSVYGGTIIKPNKQAEKDAEEVLNLVVKTFKTNKAEIITIKTIEI